MSIRGLNRQPTNRARGVRISVRFGIQKEPNRMLCSGKKSTGNRMAEQKLAADSISLYESIKACEQEHSTLFASERKQIESMCRLSTPIVLSRMSVLTDI